MRVAVVGATGNAGTAVLRALQSTPEVTSVLGIARRMPDTSVEPYRGCDWASIDIAAASSAEDAVSRLRDAFAGVDAIIHLAWLIQPNSRRELLRRVNVEGTARVAQAAAAAGVGHLVVASSVGAYSPDRARTLRDETWPVGGIRTSHYSVDKAAQERVLDAFAGRHPETIVTRFRPALIFHVDAGSQIQRYFLSGLVPVQALRAGKPPVLPLPKGLRGVQAVHGDDLGRAYAAAVVARQAGAFNICADDVLDAQDLAGIIDHGRYVGLPPRLMRGAMSVAHRTGVVAADAGWLDMGMQVPMMDNAKAKSTLDWQPKFSSADALRSLLEGMVSGQGMSSVPMRPRDPKRSKVQTERRATVRSGTTADARISREGGAARSISIDLVNLYLSDHLTGATAGAERIGQMATLFIDTPVYAPLSELADEIRLEREFLRQLIQDLGMRRLRHRQAISWVGERIARLKSNGVVGRRSPLTLVLDIELMRSAVMGKMGAWQTLEDLAPSLGLDPEVFGDLASNTSRQAKTLEDAHEYARRRAFRTDRETFTPNTPDEPHDHREEPR